MNELFCPICHINNYRTVLESNDFSIIKCVKCGLARTYPIPYESEISSQEYQKDDFYDRIERKQLYRSFTFNILNEVEKEKKAGRILDIGCSVGILLECAKERGWTPYGVDIDVRAASYGNQVLGLNIIPKDLKSAGFSDNYFDVIVMSHVLEHFVNPAEILLEAKRILDKKGILVISIPNLGGLIPRILQANWYGLAPKQHVWQFTPLTCAKLLNKYGFSIKHVNTSQNMHYEFGKKIKGQIKRIIWKLAEIVQLSDNAIIIAKER